MIKRLGILAIVLAATFHVVTERAFQPVKAIVDLSHADQQPALEGPWDLKRDPKFPGVMSARDRGQPVSVLLTLPVSAAYEGRIKLKALQPDAAVDVRMNDTLIATLHVSRVGKAKKFAVRVSAKAVVPGTNRLVFVNRGSAGAVEYELVRLQNYRAAIVKGRAYLVPRRPAVPLRGAGLLRTMLMVAGMAAVVFLGLWLLAEVVGKGFARLEGTSVLVGRRRAAAACWGSAILGIAAVVLSVTPAQLSVTPPTFWQWVTGLIGIGQAIFLMKGALQMLGRRLAAFAETLQGAREAVRGVRLDDSLQLGRTMARRGASQFAVVVRQCVAVTIVGVRWGVVRFWRVSHQGLLSAWRWFLRYQYPQGYGKLFCYLLAGALVSHWLFRWDRLAEPLGYLAGVALVIAVVWESLVSLKEDE